MVIFVCPSAFIPEKGNKTIQICWGDNCIWSRKVIKKTYPLKIKSKIKHDEQTQNQILSCGQR